MVGTPDGRWAFASLSNRTSGAIGVMAVARGTLRLVRTVPLPHTLAAAYGMTLTHDGRLLLVAGEAATAVASRSRATATPKPICWNMTSCPRANPAKTVMTISTGLGLRPGKLRSSAR
jgi:hypothetical protein